MTVVFSDADLDAIAERLKVMGHELRLRLLHRLMVSGEQSVGELETLTGIGQPGLSQQLGILRSAELVKTRRVSKLVYYSVAPEALSATVILLGQLAGLPSNDKPDRLSVAQLRTRGSAATFAKIL